MFSDNFPLVDDFLHLIVDVSAHHLFASVQGPKHSQNSCKRHFYGHRNAGKYLCGQYLGCRVSTQCLDPILELRLLTDFLGLESWPAPASWPAALVLRSLLILLTANMTLGCSSSQARHIFQIKEFGDRTLETCLNKEHNKLRVNGSLLKLEFFS